MFNISKKPDFWLPERLVTPEKVYWNRRKFLRQLGYAGAAGSAMLSGGAILAADAPTPTPAAATKPKVLYPAKRNPEFSPRWELSDEHVAATYNNFYEFSTDKEAVHRLTAKFKTKPWSIDIGGLVEKPMKVDAEELIAMMDLEERVYRFRCVEAWAMIVPWTGFQFSKILEMVKPKSEAKFVKFTTFNRPDEAPGMQRMRSYPWPYTEGLRLDEAMHPLTLVGTGIYGKPMPKQHGAPIRIVVPWKYGYKSIKSIVKIELVAKQPPTLWETLAPDEYPFESNVNPAIPHPRWSQATERLIDTGDRVRSQLYNGYGKQVAALYPKA